MVSDQEVRVIDFKSAAEPEASHLSQVQEYCRVAAEIFPAKVVRGFLLMLETGRLIAVEGCSS